MKKYGGLVCFLLVLSLLLLAGCGAKDEWEAAEKMAKIYDEIQNTVEKKLDKAVANYTLHKYSIDTSP